jgi:hypothetical protein
VTCSPWVTRITLQSRGSFADAARLLVFRQDRIGADWPRMRVQQNTEALEILLAVLLLDEIWQEQKLCNRWHHILAGKNGFHASGL